MLVPGISGVYSVIFIFYQGSCSHQHTNISPKLEDFVWFEDSDKQTLRTYQHADQKLVNDFSETKYKDGTFETDNLVFSPKFEDLVWFETPDVISYPPQDVVEDELNYKARKTKSEENLCKIENQVFAEYFFANNKI